MIQIVKVQISPTSYEHTSINIFNWAKAHDSRYICAANVHVTMEAFDSPEFRRALNQADLIFPDGMPLAWMMRLKGQHGQKQVRGPALMLHVLERAARENIAVGFYGGAPNVLDLLINRLTANIPNLRIAYSFSPPYRDLSSDEDTEIVQKINDSDARILFVGLGCPKQERWMADHRGKVHAVMLGVGAAFDFHAGVKLQPPLWMQKIGLEWFYRLITEPRRLWWRYLYHNPRFVFLAMMDLLGLIR